MRNTLTLSKYLSKTILRDKTIVGLILILPVILVYAGSASAPDRDLIMKLDNVIIQPLPKGIDVSVTLYAIAAVVLVASIVSFFLGFNMKPLIPRLKQVNYSSNEIMFSFIFIMLAINIFLSLVITAFSLFWLDIEFLFGFFIGLILASLIFSTLGLIIAELVGTTSLGLYTVITLAILDTTFLENPVFSKRYTEEWIKFMPSHESVQLIFRTIYDTGVSWNDNIGFIVLYEIVLIIIYSLLSKFKKR